MEKKQKGCNLIAYGTTQKNDYFIKEKEVECLISVSRLGLTKPNQNTGESLWQAFDPKDQVVKVGPGVDVGYPLQTTKRDGAQVVSLGDSAEGAITRPIGPVEATPTEVSSTKRIHLQTIELLGMIHRRPIKILLDIGSTGNYISKKIAQSFNFIIQAEEQSEQLTLADGCKVQSHGYVSF